MQTITQTTAQKPDVLTYRQVLRENIPAERLLDVAESQKGHARGRAQRANLRALATKAREDRGW